MKLIEPMIAPSMPSAIGSKKFESAEVIGVDPLEPTCRHTGMSVSWQAAQIGSQNSDQNDGSPNGVAFSTKQSARAPLPTQRSISTAAARGSHSGAMIMGTNSPGGPPGAHSSRIKSFHAR